MRTVALSAAVTICSLAASAQTYVNSTRFAYTGTVTRYATEDDARAGTNALFTGSFADLADPTRDLRIQINDDFGNVDGLVLGTAWSPNTNTGAANPNNINPGFVQVYDPGITSSTVASAWDATWTVFSLEVSGTSTRTVTGDQYGTRLWNLAATPAHQGQGGTFLSYEFSMTATVALADAARWNETLGLYATMTDNVAVSGSFSGLFENTSAEPAYHGFYTFDLTLNADSWAYANRASLTTSPRYQTTILGSAIPEPSTYACGLGLAALAVVVWRRRRR